MSEAPRMLNRPLDMNRYVEVDGGLLVKEVPLLTCGVWTDSKARTPLHYGPKALEASVGNWFSDGYWVRHAGGSPRSIMELIGNVVVPSVRFDPRYMEQGMTEPGAVLGDVFYSYSTQNGRDAAAQAIARAKAGKPLAVSVEHGGVEEFDPQTKRLEARTVEYYGLASVERGACKVCTLPKRAGEEPPEETVREMDEAGIAKLLSDAEARILKAVDDRLAALNKVPAEQAKSIQEMGAANEGLARELSEAKKTIEALKVDSARELGEAVKRITALEKSPNPRTRPEEQRSLEAPVNPVRWDQRNGRVGL